MRASPDLADLARRAEHVTPDLWPKARTAPDCLHVRLGLGVVTTRFEVRLEPGGLAHLRDEASAALAGSTRLAGAPIVVDLTGAVLAVEGDPSSVDGIAAAIVVQSACLHAPDDLVIVGAIAPRRGFEWLKWLPHTRSPLSPLRGSHVASTPAAANALVSAAARGRRQPTPHGRRAPAMLAADPPDR